MLLLNSVSPLSAATRSTSSRLLTISSVSSSGAAQMLRWLSGFMWQHHSFRSLYKGCGGVSCRHFSQAAHWTQSRVPVRFSSNG